MLKRLFTICCLGLLMLVACSRGPSKDEGGTSGGGGDTVVTDPVTMNQIVNAIDESKPLISFYLKALRESEILQWPALETWLSKISVEVKFREPCFDSRHHDRDGSVYSSAPNAICISAFRLAGRLSRSERYSHKVAALIFHELSHLAGADEAEAVKLQNGIQTYLDSAEGVSATAYFRSRVDYFQYLFTSGEAPEGYDGHSGEWLSELSLSNSGLSGMCSSVAAYLYPALEQMAAIVRPGDKSHLPPLLTGIDARQAFTAFTKLKLGADYICAADATVAPETAAARFVLYEQSFAGQADTGVFNIALWDYSTARFSRYAEIDAKVLRIDGKPKLMREIYGAMGLTKPIVRELRNTCNQRFTVIYDN